MRTRWMALSAAVLVLGGCGGGGTGQPDAGNAPPAACGTANGTVVTHSGNITADETWAGNGVTHSITSSVRIKAPATVTVQPCAIVSVAQNAEIGVEGDTAGSRPARLVAAGTDDQTGFVSFLPAAQGQFWGTLRGYNEQSFIELHHAGLVAAGAGLVGYRNSAIVMEGPGLNATAHGATPHRRPRGNRSPPRRRGVPGWDGRLHRGLDLARDRGARRTTRSRSSSWPRGASPDDGPGRSGTTTHFPRRGSTPRGRTSRRHDHQRQHPAVPRGLGQGGPDREHHHPARSDAHRPAGCGAALQAG